MDYNTTPSDILTRILEFLSWNDAVATGHVSTYMLSIFKKTPMCGRCRKSYIHYSSRVHCQPRITETWCYDCTRCHAYLCCVCDHYAIPGLIEWGDWRPNDGVGNKTTMPAHINGCSSYAFDIGNAVCNYCKVVLYPGTAYGEGWGDTVCINCSNSNGNCQLLMYNHDNDEHNFVSP